MNKLILTTALCLGLVACNGANVKPPTVVEVSCTTAAGLWYEVGKKYHAGKYTEQDVADLKADAKVLDPKCETTPEPTTAELMADPAVIAAMADLTKKATQ